MNCFKLCATVLIAVFAVFCAKAHAAGGDSCGYNLASPSAICTLPDALREISGLTYADPSSLACIQDENGILFFIDPASGQIRTQKKFADDGDYEGIARIDSTVYVLRSDGNLFEINDYLSATPTVNFHATGIPGEDNEGLCYDALNNRLLIATKSNPGRKPGDKDIRVVYGFNVETKTLTERPVFVFDLPEIRKTAGRMGIVLPAKSGKKETSPEPEIKMRPSGICIHPLTKELYLLSAADYLLFVFTPDGAVGHIEPLSPAIFNKAEGITFSPNGDLFISNEGEDGSATIRRFDFQGK